MFSQQKLARNISISKINTYVLYVYDLKLSKTLVYRKTNVKPTKSRVANVLRTEVNIFRLFNFQGFLYCSICGSLHYWNICNRYAIHTPHGESWHGSLQGTPLPTPLQGNLPPFRRYPLPSPLQAITVANQYPAPFHGPCKNGPP